MADQQKNPLTPPPRPKRPSKVDVDQLVRDVHVHSPSSASPRPPRPARPSRDDLERLIEVGSPKAEAKAEKKLPKPKAGKRSSLRKKEPSEKMNIRLSVPRSRVRPQTPPPRATRRTKRRPVKEGSPSATHTESHKKLPSAKRRSLLKRPADLSLKVDSAKPASSSRPLSARHRPRRVSHADTHLVPKTPPAHKNRPRRASVSPSPSPPVTPTVHSARGLVDIRGSSEEKAHAALVEKRRQTKDQKGLVEDNERLRLRREKVTDEIIQTETTYVGELRILLVDYLQPLQKEGLLPKSSRPCLALMASAVAEILTLHEIFLADLKKKREKMMDVFLEFVEHMKRYFRFVQNLPSFNRNMTAATSRKLRSFLDAASKKTGRQSIRDLLITPVQRIPRYQLMVDRLEKLTPESHPAIGVMRKVLFKLIAVADQVNECRQGAENSAVLFELQQKLRDLPRGLRILTPTRKYIRRGVFTELPDPNELSVAVRPPKHPNKHSIRLFLFNDMLLCTDYKHRHKWHLDLREEVEIKDHFDTMFQIYSGINASILNTTALARDKRERDQWKETIGAQLQEQLDHRNKLLLRQQQRKKGKGSTTSQLECKTSDSVEQINVFMRVRPLITPEEKENGSTCVSVSGDLASCHVVDETKEYDKVALYDECFGSNSHQLDVFERVGQETLGAMFAGFNTAILAYGNTGAGKTHTMFGSFDQESEAEAEGLIPQMMRAMFEVLNSPGVYSEFNVEIAYIQIYNNQIQDLQSESPMEQSLDISAHKGVHRVSHLIWTEVDSCKQVMQILKESNTKRVTRAHRMNEMSSRSHAVFMIRLKAERSDNGLRFQSRLYMVDLAGSENAKETGAEGVMLEEAKHINRSLSALGRIVSVLLQNKERALNNEKKQPVPFRDSKLTHLLAEVLSGEFVCSLILNVSPSPVFHQDVLTAKTMTFGEGVKKLAIHAQKNTVQASGFKHFLIGVWKTVARNK